MKKPDRDQGVTLFSITVYSKLFGFLTLSIFLATSAVYCESSQHGESQEITGYIEKTLGSKDKQPEDFRFGLAADTHLNFGGPDRWRDKQILSILRSWAKAKVAFGVIVGDVGTYNTTVKYGEEDISQTNKLKSLIASVPDCPPVFFTMGNHDLDGDGKKAWLETFYPGVNANITGNGNDRYFYFSFDYGKCHFFCLDTNRMENGKILYKAMPEKEYNWIEDDLRKNSGKLTFVLIHEPLEGYCYRGKGDLVKLCQGVSPYHLFSSRGRLVSLLNQFPDVKWVFSGHLHLYSHFKNFAGLNVCKVGFDRSRIIQVDGNKAQLFDVNEMGQLTLVKCDDYGEMLSSAVVKKGQVFIRRIAEDSVMKVYPKYNPLVTSVTYVESDDDVTPTFGSTMIKVERELPAKDKNSFTPLYCYVNDDMIKIRKGMKFSYDVRFDPNSVYTNFALEVRITPRDGGEIPLIADSAGIPMNTIGVKEFGKFGWRNNTYYSPSLGMLAKGVWYHREFDLSPLEGEYISMIELYATCPDNAPYPAGNLKFYIDNIKLTWPESSN